MKTARMWYLSSKKNEANKPICDVREYKQDQILSYF